MTFEASCPHSDRDLCLLCAGRLACDECGASPAWPQLELDAGRPSARSLCLICTGSETHIDETLALTIAGQAS